MMKVVGVEELDTKRRVDQGTEQQRAVVTQILHDVQKRGDEAVQAYTEKFDHVGLSSFAVTESEWNDAYHTIDDDVLNALREATQNIRRYHEKQKQNSWFTTEASGTMLGQVIRPLKRVGIYVPGGTAAYPSSVLMNTIPAQVAGVEDVIMVTPPRRDGTVDPAVLIAANELGIKRVYKMGGAQAIAALAYGTETVPAVDKIVGPGNLFVALAKREVFGLVDIDMVAGPSEIVVLADRHANPAYIAADLLSQAEHDERASAVLVTPSQTLAEQVQQEVEGQLSQLPRFQIAQSSIENYGAICVVNDLQQGFDVVNQLAPEHLELLIENAVSYVGKVKNAGAIFLGPYSTEPVGDYFAGPNHVLPTNGTARFSSPLSVDDFMKKSSLISYSSFDLLKNGEQIATLARQEGLEAHARAVEVRLQDLTKEKEQGES